VIITRALDGSYALGGRFHAVVRNLDMEHKADDAWHWTRRSPRFLSNMSVFFLVHANGAKYYTELTSAGKEAHTSCVALATGAAALTVILCLLSEHLTFEGHSSDLLLDNYSSKDPLANAARGALALGVVGSLVLLFSGLQEVFLAILASLMPVTTQQMGEVSEKLLSLLLFALVVAVAILEDGDVTLTIIVRSTFGALLIFTIPAVLYLKSARRVACALPCHQRLATTSLGILGLVLTVFGFLVHTDPILRS